MYMYMYGLLRSALCHSPQLSWARTHVYTCTLYICYISTYDVLCYCFSCMYMKTQPRTSILCHLVPVFASTRHLVGGSSSMTDSERDEIDSEAQKFIQLSRDRINSLQKHCMTMCVCVCLSYMTCTFVYPYTNLFTNSEQ